MPRDDRLEKKDGSLTGRFLSNLDVKIFNAWLYLMPTCLDNLINKRKINCAVFTVMFVFSIECPFYSHPQHFLTKTFIILDWLIRLLK